MHYLFIGNPGVGKSTLLNCLIGQYVFKSGVSLGTGLTYQLDKRQIGGSVYMDTPGLEDVRMRQQAAAAITEALKQNGEYKIFFVVTLDSGRIRPVDAALINLVLENAPDIRQYSVVFNKLTEPLYQRLQNGADAAQLVNTLTGAGESGRHSKLFLKVKPSLTDIDDRFEHMPELNSFARDAPVVQISSPRVHDLPGDNTFDQRVQNLQQQADQLHQENQALAQQVSNIQQQIHHHSRRRKRRGLFGGGIINGIL